MQPSQRPGRSPEVTAHDYQRQRCAKKKKGWVTTVEEWTGYSLGVGGGG